MPKYDSTFDLAGYAPVADRIQQFYARFSTGRIVTELISRHEGEIVFRALVYRDGAESQPAATGWAAEREDDGDVNAVACLENAETSAIGRALANLGFTASRQRPSAEEMAKAARGRARLARRGHAVHEPRSASAESAYLADLLTLIGAAQRVGLRARRGAAWRARLATASTTDAELLRLESRLRGWIARQNPHRLH